MAATHGNQDASMTAIRAVTALDWGALVPRQR
jgi:hypothetical protein